MTFGNNRIKQTEFLHSYHVGIRATLIDSDIYWIRHLLQTDNHGRESLTNSVVWSAPS